MKRNRERASSPAASNLAATNLAATNPSPTGSQRPPPPAVNMLFPAYLAAIFAGYILLRIPGAMIAGQQMGKVRALFSAVSAGTLTGFTQPAGIDTYEPLGQGVILGLILLGSLLTLIISGTAISRILRLDYSDRAIFIAAIITQAAAIVAGGFFLLFDSDRTIFQAVFLAASAFGNCGLILGPAPPPDSWLTHLVVLPLITAGGCGVCVLLELWRRPRRKSPGISTHARVVLGMAAWMYIGGTLILTGIQLLRGGSFPSALTAGAAAAVATRSAGMGLIDLGHLTRPAVWLVMALMAAGAASGGTAGGIKTTTLFELFRGVASALTGKPISRTFGIAAVWAGIYLALVLATVLLLLTLLPQTEGDRVLFLAVSAASNVGLSPDALNPDAAPAFVLCATMLIGRFGPMMILWWMADSTRDAELAVG